MKKTVLDYCITLTMCSIDGVDSVSTYVGNEVFESGMRAEDVLLKNTVESAQSAEIRLYFPSAEGKLRCEYRSISLEDESSPERAAADALTAGPESPELYPALPAGTVLLSVYTQDGVCFVSLSESFVSACEEHPVSAHSEVVHKAVVVVFGDDADFVNAAVDEVRQSKVDKAISAAVRKRSDGAVNGKLVQMTFGSACENDAHSIVQHNSLPPIL